MISCDTNILFPAFNKRDPLHERARGYMTDLEDREDFCLCEQVLLELYCLLRNPTVCSHPMTPASGVSLIEALRSNPRWRIVDVVLTAGIMDKVWALAGQQSLPYRRVLDLRLGFTLRHHGVTEFATRNTGDFLDCGFARVWNPLD